MTPNPDNDLMARRVEAAARAIYMYQSEANRTFAKGTTGYEVEILGWDFASDESKHNATIKAEAALAAADAITAEQSQNADCGSKVMSAGEFSIGLSMPNPGYIEPGSGYEDVVAQCVYYNTIRVKERDASIRAEAIAAKDARIAELETILDECSSMVEMLTDTGILPSQKIHGMFLDLGKRARKIFKETTAGMTDGGA